MGTRTLIDFNRQPGNIGAGLRPAQNRRPALRFQIDLLLVLAVIALVIFGVLMVYSASSDFSYQWYGSATHVFERQLIWLGLGTLVCAFLTWMDYHYWRKFALPLMVVSIVGLIAVLFLQDERLGAVRSLFGGSVQPSELAKLALVIYLSVWLYNRRDQLRDLNLGLIPMGVILGLVGSFIVLQPDLSALITICALGVMMFFLVGGDLRQLLVVMALGTIVGVIVLRSGIFPTGTERVNSFLEGIKDPLKYSDHVQRSLEAFIRGGWFGVGIGNSRTKLFNLPFPHTDSVFAVVGEETGFVGAVLLIILYICLMWRGLVIARRAPDGLGMLLAGGLGFWLATEAFINMSVMVGLMPFAGNALPFISAGGSNLMVTMAAVGIMLNVSRSSEKSRQKEERTFSAVVDLRRRDGRRSVSRTRRPANDKR
jgi:cell division protein FtsW